MSWLSEASCFLSGPLDLPPRPATSWGWAYQVQFRFLGFRKFTKPRELRTRQRAKAGGQWRANVAAGLFSQHEAPMFSQGCCSCNLWNPNWRVGSLSRKTSCFAPGSVSCFLLSYDLLLRYLSLKSAVLHVLPSHKFSNCSSELGWRWTVLSFESSRVSFPMIMDQKISTIR